MEAGGKSVSKLARYCLGFVAVVTVMFATFSNTAAANLAESSPSLQRRATLAIAALQSWYDPATGLYRTTGWWNSANAITVLADYSRVAHTRKYWRVFRNTQQAAQKTAPGFLNHYYDDEGWWALAWIDAYDVTHHAPYLDTAASIFSDMAQGWDNTCSGGIWWSKDRTYKNAIANELFLSVAAHLAVRAKSAGQRAAYIQWANREWSWFEHSGMINSGHLVNDGLNGHCENNMQTTWTYNQGVILGGLAELYRATGDRSLLASATRIANAALSDPALVDSAGILHEPCEPRCGGDGTQFKGIFVRNLLALDREAPKARYRTFVLRNAESIWNGVHAPGYRLGLIWSAPYGTADANASTQSSAADALIAAAALESRRPSR